MENWEGAVGGDGGAREEDGASAAAIAAAITGSLVLLCRSLLTRRLAGGAGGGLGLLQRGLGRVPLGQGQMQCSPTVTAGQEGASTYADRDTGGASDTGGTGGEHCGDCGWVGVSLVGSG